MDVEETKGGDGHTWEGSGRGEKGGFGCVWAASDGLKGA